MVYTVPYSPGAKYYRLCKPAGRMGIWNIKNKTANNPKLKKMKKLTLITVIIATSMLAILFACNTKTTAATGDVQISQDSLVKLGGYLVNTMGCDDCHSPKKMGPMGPEVDMNARFSGHQSNPPLPAVDTMVINKGWILFSMGLTAFTGPWGQSYAANISSDQTGIGNWTEEQFFRALREGKSKGLAEGRPLLPPMPWQQYGLLKDQDIKAIFAFLKTTKPVENRVPEWKKWNELK